MARTSPHSSLVNVRDKLLYAFKEKVDSYVVTGLWRGLFHGQKKYEEFDDDESDNESLEEDEEL